ncbi:MAG: cytoskeleton protein RodZ, partial [Candidatus Paceibacteria bacterium]
MIDVEPLDMQDQQELDGQLPGFPGHLLRQAREELGLSQKEAARDLHLTSKVINAIEEDNFELIPSSLFARGYIRSFARHVGLDGQALVAEFDAVYGAPNHGTKPMPGIPKGGSQ